MGRRSTDLFLLLLRLLRGRLWGSILLALLGLGYGKILELAVGCVGHGVGRVRGRLVGYLQRIMRVRCGTESVKASNARRTFAPLEVWVAGRSGIRNNGGVSGDVGGIGATKKVTLWE